MKITLEPTHNKSLSKVVIETPCDHNDLDSVMQNLIKPALLDWGFQPGSINEYIEEE